jgi:hypothetical protein
MGRKFNPLELEEYMGPRPIKVSSKNLEYPIQNDLFESIYLHSPQVNYGYRKRIGDFYEILTTGIFGGQWVGTQNVSNEENGCFQPDVISSNKIIESKSVCWKETLKLTDFQIDQYLFHQCDGSKPDKIFFAIYKYGLRNPLIHFKTFKQNILEQIVSSLSQETSFMLFLPFSVIFSLHDPEILCSEFKSRYERGNFDPLSRFNSTGLKKMLQSPEEVLISYNLNPNNYLIRKTRLPFGMTINNNPIKPFPVLYIEDKNHQEWIKDFKEANWARVQKILNDNLTKAEYLLRREGCSDVDLDEPEQEREEDLDSLPF